MEFSYQKPTGEVVLLKTRAEKDSDNFRRRNDIP